MTRALKFDNDQVNGRLIYPLMWGRSLAIQGVKTVA